MDVWYLLINLFQWERAKQTVLVFAASSRKEPTLLTTTVRAAPLLSRKPRRELVSLPPPSRQVSFEVQSSADGDDGSSRRIHILSLHFLPCFPEVLTEKESFLSKSSPSSLKSTQQTHETLAELDYVVISEMTCLSGKSECAGQANWCLMVALSLPDCQG